MVDSFLTYILENGIKLSQLTLDNKADTSKFLTMPLKTSDCRKHCLDICLVIDATSLITNLICGLVELQGVKATL